MLKKWLGPLLGKIGFSATLLITLWFVGQATSALIHYFRLSSHQTALVINWDVQEENKRFLPAASYTFQIGDKTFEGKSPIREKKYLNHWAASGCIKELKGKTFEVWYNPKDPEEATLDRRFPFKAVGEALLLLGITAYFFTLFLLPKGKFSNLQGHGARLYNARGQDTLRSSSEGEIQPPKGDESNELSLE